MSLEVGDSASLVVVANRLPVAIAVQDGPPAWNVSPGGLAAALTPLLRGTYGVWVGWPGQPGDVSPPSEHEGIALRSVPLSAREYDDFYVGFSNRTLWPLYHDAVRAPSFDREWWHAYVAVNERYAQAVAEVAEAGATVWVHDYQLQLVPKLLRARRPDVRIGFFLHIPFPPQELFTQLPWRREIIDGLLGADLVGFQVPGAAANFARLARRLTGAVGTDALLTYEGRSVRVGAFPISIDTDGLIARAADAAVVKRAEQIRHELGDPEFVMLGVDRLDYTKGLHQRMRAVGELFDDGELSAPRHVMVQVAVPSREEDGHYQREREQLQQLVGEINGEHGRLGHPAVHYLHQSLPADDLVALYLAADLMLVTPLRDGMNLVAKEYVATRTDATGVLILSEFAGAARELQGAILVNPHDLDGIKEAIKQGLRLDPDVARQRMRRMRRTVRRRDVHAWARSFLETLAHSGSSTTAAAGASG